MLSNLNTLLLIMTEMQITEIKGERKTRDEEQNLLHIYSNAFVPAM